MAPKSPLTLRHRTQSGCASLLFIGVMTCGMVILNGMFVSITLPWLTPYLPRGLLQPKLLQSVIFILPVLLTMLQWWFIDLIGDLKRARSERRTTGK